MGYIGEGYGIMMDRVNCIWKHKDYKSYYEQIEECEKDRIFCHHDMVHFVDVARIGWIISLEENINVDKELLYAAALLHDIGRHLQYTQNIPHEIASGQLAPDILADCGFNAAEIDIVLDAIVNHRNKNIRDERSLRGVLYRADKMSRACAFCKAEPECDWSDEKKNMGIVS